jgi:hypothetical protein
MLAATTAAPERRHASGYRLKFDRDEFLKLVNIAKPAIVYKRGKNHLFAFDGFVLYSQKCSDGDFKATIIDAIEFSNSNWDT